MIAAISVGVALIGCGGSSSTSSASKPTVKTRSNVSSGHRHILLSLAGSGVQTAVQAVGMNGYGGSTGAGTTGGTGGGSVPLIGAYVRYSIVSPMLNGPHRAQRDAGIAIGPAGSEPGSGTSGSSGGSGGSGGGIMTDGVYYDEFLGLWAENTTVSPFESKTLLFLDQGKTKPEGFFDTIFPTEWNVFPIIYSSNYEITAGNYAGSHGKYDFTIATSTSGQSTYASTWAGSGTSKGTSAWSPEKYTWENRFDNVDGTWYHDAGTFKGDGSGDSLTENSAGYRWTYHFNADGSGYGKIEGPDAGLPATITWDGHGNVRIVYADGSVDEWNFGDVIYGDGTSGSGTTGSDSAGSSTTGSVTGTTGTVGLMSQKAARK